MKKAVFKVGVDDNKVKNKVLKTVSGLAGVDSVALDMNDSTITVIGDIDLVIILMKVRKLCRTDLLSVGPAKELEKKDDEKKKKDDGEPTVEESVRSYADPVNAYPYHVPSAQDNPDASACVIL